MELTTEHRTIIGALRKRVWPDERSIRYQMRQMGVGKARLKELLAELVGAGLVEQYYLDPLCSYYRPMPHLPTDLVCEKSIARLVDSGAKRICGTPT